MTTETTPRSKQIVDIKSPHELYDSVTSYMFGGGLITAATLVDVAQVAQALAIIIGCYIVGVRAVHDTVRLYRYLAHKPSKGTSLKRRK